MAATGAVKSVQASTTITQRSQSLHRCNTDITSSSDCHSTAVSQSSTAEMLIIPSSTVCRAPDVAPQLSGLFCYGCPIVGNPAFNAALAARLPHRVYNFVHASDIVTRLPASPEYGPLPGERLIKSFGRWVPLGCDAVSCLLGGSGMVSCQETAWSDLWQVGLMMACALHPWQSPACIRL